jgi:hypothetical protein
MLTKQLRVKYKKWNCVVLFVKYVQNNRVAIMLKDIDDDQHVADVTVNVPEWPIEEHDVILDTNNFPDGPTVLKNAGIIGDLKGYAQSNYCSYPIYPLTKQFQ